MKEMMSKMMSGVMKPEDMPKCLNTIFSELDSESRERLAKEIIGEMVSILNEQLSKGNE
jgi:hypothetical protein